MIISWSEKKYAFRPFLPQSPLNRPVLSIDPAVPLPILYRPPMSYYLVLFPPSEIVKSSMEFGRQQQRNEVQQQRSTMQQRQWHEDKAKRHAAKAGAMQQSAVVCSNSVLRLRPI